MRAILSALLVALLLASLVSVPSAYSQARGPEEIPETSQSPFKVRVLEGGNLKAFIVPLYTTFGDPSSNVTPRGGFYDGVADLILTRTDFTVRCTGALLSTGMHVLTAAHCVTDDKGNFILTSGFAKFEGDGGVEVADLDAAASSVHPDWDGDVIRGNDVAVLQLNSAPSIDISRYDIDRNSTNDVGLVGTKAGYGRSGSGWVGDVLDSGIKRDGWNRYDDTADTMLTALGLRAGRDFVSGSVLQYDFDNGLVQNDAFGFFFGKSDLGIAGIEVNSARGDSGSPTFTQGAITGITSYGIRLQSIFGYSTDVDDKLNSTFGEFAADTRVAHYASFIDGVTTGRGSGDGGGSGGSNSITVTDISPSSIAKQNSLPVTITGTGFKNGASVSLVNGCGPAPSVSNVQIIDSTKITATVSAKGNGPPKDCVFDVVVSNTDGTSDMLANSFKVIG